MTAPSAARSGIRAFGHRILTWLGSWWQIVLFIVATLTLLLSPATYQRAGRHAIAVQIVRATAPNLLWFSLLSALISVVLIRIVVITALSYGLSRFAIEMVVRTLVLELIPLTAAMFMALRYTVPDGTLVTLAHLRRTAAARRQLGLDPIRYEFLPRVVAGIFSVWMLAAVSCIMALVLAYLIMYGLTPSALPGYTRVVGQVFNPAVTLILVLKIFFFSLAVSFIPMASAYDDGVVRVRQKQHVGPTSSLSGMVRLFTVVLVVEMASLMGNYY